MGSFKYRRLNHWKSTQANGWTTLDVAARLEAGTRGGYYLEYLPFGPSIVEEPAALELLEMLSRTGLRGGTVLDVGCGNGVLRELLGAASKLNQWTYIGVDVNRDNIASCRRRYPDARFEVVTAGAPLPFDDASVDLVVAAGVLECVESPAHLLAECGRVTREAVALCRLGVWPAAIPSAVFEQTVHHQWGCEEHCIHVFNRVTFRCLLAQAGLSLAWEGVSVASGEWIAPDDPTPLQSFTFVLRKIQAHELLAI